MNPPPSNVSVTSASSHPDALTNQTHRRTTAHRDFYSFDFDPNRRPDHPTGSTVSRDFYSIDFNPGRLDYQTPSLSNVPPNTNRGYPSSPPPTYQSPVNTPSVPYYGQPASSHGFPGRRDSGCGEPPQLSFQSAPQISCYPPWHSHSQRVPQTPPRHYYPPQSPQTVSQQPAPIAAQTPSIPYDIDLQAYTTSHNRDDYNQRQPNYHATEAKVIYWKNRIQYLAEKYHAAQTALLQSQRGPDQPRLVAQEELDELLMEIDASPIKPRQPLFQQIDDQGRPCLCWE